MTFLYASAFQSIDLQVYIWASDETGWIMAERLIQAADRGVRVRLLIDDLGFGGSDEGIASMDAHPNIQLRVFNPWDGEYRGLVGRAVQVLAGMSQQSQHARASDK